MNVPLPSVGFKEMIMATIVTIWIIAIASCMAVISWMLTRGWQRKKDKLGLDATRHTGRHVARHMAMTGDKQIKLH
jgi:hypothetical protein